MADPIDGRATAGLGGPGGEKPDMATILPDRMGRASVGLELGEELGECLRDPHGWSLELVVGVGTGRERPRWSP